MRLRHFGSAIAAALAALACASAAVGASTLQVSVDRTAISIAIGHKFVLRSTISNRGPAPAGNLIAHLNILSLRGDVYVDPEDWSSNRSRYLAPIPAGGSVDITWKLQAVNSGSIAVFVAVLPRSGAPQPPVAGPTVHVSIARRQTLNSGGILPLALGIPAGLSLLIVGVRWLRRRQMSA